MAEDQLFQPLTREQLLAQPPQFTPPQLPLQPQWPVQPDATGTTGAGINPQLFGEPGAAQIDRHAALAARADQLQKQQNSFLPNALAIGALLTGDFKPMMQLEDQKRRTQLAQVFGPTALEATKLAQRGELEQAEALITDVSGRVGDRSPELTQFFNSIRGDIKKAQTDWRDAAQVADYMKGVPDTAHPDVIRFRDFIQKAVKNRTPMSAALTASLFDKALPEGQMFNNQSLQRGRLGGEVTSVPLPNVLSARDIEGPVGDLLSARTGLQLPIINDVLNLKQGMPPVALPSGGSIGFGSPAHQQLLNMWQGTAQTRAELALTEKQPKSPEVTYGLKQEGVSNLEINTGTYPLHKLGGALLRAQADKIGVASAAELVKINQNPFIAFDKNAQAVNGRSGLAINTPLSLDEARKSNDPVLWLPKDIYKEQYLPSMEALKGFDRLEPFIESLGNPQTWGDRFDSGAFRWVTDTLGIAVAKNAEPSKVLQDVLNKSIEITMSKAGVDVKDIEVGRIKQLVTGIGNNPAGARAAIAEMRQLLQDRVLRATGEAGLTTGRAAPSVVTNPRGGTAPVTTAAPTGAIPGVPTPNVRQVPAPGVTPGAEYRQPGGGFVPSGATGYTPPNTGKRQTKEERRIEANRRAVEVLGPVIDSGTTETAATPAQPAQQKRFTIGVP